MHREDPSLWNFVHWDSIWPLPHVVLAYHAYMYTRNWISVLCTYYLFKVIQLLLFSLFGLGHEHFFAEILQNRPNGVGSCVVDFNGLFIGGTIQTLLGIFLGMVHCHAVCPSLNNPRNFLPVHFWKAPKFLTRGDRPEPHLSHLHNRRKLAAEKMAGTRSFFANNGLWPPFTLFGLQAEEESQGTSSYQGWAFRKIFWKRWVQLVLLGTPALFFYTLTPKSSMLRAGSVFYGFVTCSLVLIYKFVNQETYYDWLVDKHGAEERLRDREKARLTLLLELTRSSYDSTYALWIFAVAFLIGFQSIPVLNSFYKVLLASTTLAAFVLLSYYAAKGVEKSLLQNFSEPERGEKTKVGRIFALPVVKNGGWTNEDFSIIF